MRVGVEDISVDIAPHLEKTGGVITALRAIQNRFGCVPESVDETVAAAFNLSQAEIRGIVSFYADLTREPKAKIEIRLCAAEACQAVGGRRLQREVEALINEYYAANTPAKVAIEPVYCLGLCSAAPAAMVGDELVGRADVQRISNCLTQQRNSAF